ncbi:MAG: type II toxin-antitoxin system RelE/ParE family toxin [Rhizomicrobium sp.]
MIKTFKDKGLKELFERGRTSRIATRFHDRCREILDVINRAAHTNQMNLPGYVLHPMHQFDPIRWTIRVTAQWRITFEFRDGDAYRVDFEQYH